MAIRYRVQQVANTPGKFYRQVIEEGVDDDATAIREIAEKTQQTEAVVRTVLNGAGQVLVESVLAGRGLYLPGLGKVTFSIEAKLDQHWGAASPACLPASAMIPIAFSHP